MKDKILVLMLGIFMIISMPMVGTGISYDMEDDEIKDDEIKNYIGIEDWYDLEDVDDDLDADYKLMNDLDDNTDGYDDVVATIQGFVPIAFHEDYEFTGTFDGNGYEIRDLIINQFGNKDIGLFSYVDDAEIKNLHIDGYVEGGEDVGVLGGTIADSTINNVSASGELYYDDEGYSGGLIGYSDINIIKNSSANVDIDLGGGETEYYDIAGGLIGYTRNSDIEYSYAEGDVRGNENVGGLVGRHHGDITKSYATGDVEGESHNIGGLVGYTIISGLGNKLNIIDCYALGNVNGEGSNVGGLVGYARATQSSDNTIRISNSYALGNVNGEGDRVGGLVGRILHSDYDDTIHEIYYTYAEGDVHGNQYVGGLIGYSSDVTVWRVYATGEVTGDDAVGGLIGLHTSDSTLLDSRGDKDTTGLDNVFGIDNGMDDNVDMISTEDMQDFGTWDFLSWDIATIDDYDDERWYIDDGEDYPRFGYELQRKLEWNIDGDGEIYINGNWYDDDGYEMFDHDSTIDLNANADYGWVFDEWSGDLVSDDKDEEIIMDEDKNITLNFVLEEFELEIDIEGEGNTTPEEGTHYYEYGTEVVIEYEEVYGWVFEEWLGNGETIDGDRVVNITEDKEVTAVFVRDEFELSWNIDGEGDVFIDDEWYSDSGSRMFEYEDVVDLNADADEDWFFDMWTGDISSNDADEDIKMTEDKDITAVFLMYSEFEVDIINTNSPIIEGDVLYVDVDVHNIGDEEDTQDIILRNYGWDNEDVDTKSVTLDGGDDTNIQLEWNTEVGDGEKTDDIQVLSGDNTDYEEVTIEYIKYTLNWSIEGDGEIFVEDNWYDDDSDRLFDRTTEVDLNADAEYGWLFSEWTGDLESTEQDDSILMNDNKVITLNFVRDTFDLEIVIDGEGETNPSEGIYTYEYEEVVTIKYSEVHGWVFDEWSGDGITEDDDRIVNMTEDKLVTAHFERDTFELEIDVEGEGETTPEEGTHEYEYEETVYIEYTEIYGWVFDEWSGDGENVDDDRVVEMTDDKYVLATFERDIFELDINIEGEGNTTPEEGTHEYEYEEEVVVEYTEVHGWVFDSYDGDGVTEDDKRIIEMTEDKSLEVFFVRDTFELEINVIGGGESTPEEGVYEFEYEEVVEISYTEVHGWIFNSYDGDGENIGDERHVEIDDDKYVEVIFDRDTFTLSWDMSEGGEIVIDGQRYNESGSKEFEFEDSVRIEADAYSTGIFDGDDEWYFVNWTGDLESDSSIETIVIEDDMEIHAEFEDTEVSRLISAITSLSFWTLFMAISMAIVTTFYSNNPDVGMFSFFSVMIIASAIGIIHIVITISLVIMMVTFIIWRVKGWALRW